MLAAAVVLPRAACWGGVVLDVARARGARGTVIDGYCRDNRRIVGMGYPVWCRGGLPLDCKGRMAVTAWRQPAVVGGLLVQPGDLVVADVDGVAAVPAGLAPEVVQRAAQKAEKENGLRDALVQGSTLRDAYDRFGASCERDSAIGSHRASQLAFERSSAVRVASDVSGRPETTTHAESSAYSYRMKVQSNA